MSESAKIYQFKVSLDHVSPPVWRRIQVSEKTTLFELHKVIQIIMEWQGHHLHQFIINGQYYTDISDQEDWESDSEDEFAYNLKALKLKTGSRFKYEYDFGDDWSHTLILEEILPYQKGVRYPICIKGKNACPPDDVGGPWGYKNLLEAIKNPNHEEHESIMIWIEGEFDPKAFDLEEINQELFEYAYKNWPLNVEFPFKYWMTRDPILNRGQLVELLNSPEDHFDWNFPLIKNATVFLIYLMKNKVTGTPAIGNLPRKAIRGIASQFVNSQELLKRLDDPKFSRQNEDSVRDIYFVHILLLGAGLIDGGRGLQWQVTTLGQDFLSETIENQYLILFEAWWFRINWIVISVFNIFGGFLPEEFPYSVVEIMKNKEPGILFDYDVFIDMLEKMNFLENPYDGDAIFRLRIKLDIEIMLIEPLSKLGLISPHYVDDPAFKFSEPKLTSFNLTNFGCKLFDYMAKNKIKPF